MLPEAQTLGIGNAVRLEENHCVPNGTLFVPCFFNHRGAFFADAGHVRQARGGFIEDVKRVFAEKFDNLSGILFADAVNEPAAQILTDAVNVRRQSSFEGGTFELFSELFMLLPPAAHRQGLAALHAGKMSRDRNGAPFVT